MEFPFRTSTPSQSEIFSEKFLLCLVHLEFHFRTSTPSQSEIFFQSPYFGLLSLLVCMFWPFRTSAPSQSEIFSQSYFCCLLSLLVSMHWPSRTSTPSQSKIFSQAVIVACSLCSYVKIGLPGPAHPPKVKYSVTAVILVCLYGISFQDLHTLLKWNILWKLLLCLAISVLIRWPFRTSTPSQSEIFSQSYFCC